jgi:hypothetical protein
MELPTWVKKPTSAHQSDLRLPDAGQVHAQPTLVLVQIRNADKNALAGPGVNVMITVWAIFDNFRRKI